MSVLKYYQFVAVLFCGLLYAQVPDCDRRLAEDFVPMTLSERLVNAERSVAAPSAFLYTGLRAGLDQAIDRPAAWQGGVRGYGLRSGSAYAELFIGQVFEQGVGYLRHEDNRYFASGKHGIAPRVQYAVASTFLARHDDGSRGVSISALTGAAGGALLSRPWQPQGPSSAVTSFGLTLGVRTGLNLIREFAPHWMHPILQ